MPGAVRTLLAIFKNLSLICLSVVYSLGAFKGRKFLGCDYMKKALKRHNDHFY